LQYGLHSPFVVNEGTSGSIKGATSLIFPDLDPKKFKETAIETGKDLFSTLIGNRAGSDNTSTKVVELTILLKT